MVHGVRCTVPLGTMASMRVQLTSRKCLGLNTPLPSSPL